MHIRAMSALILAACTSTGDTGGQSCPTHVEVTVPAGTSRRVAPVAPWSAMLCAESVCVPYELGALELGQVEVVAPDDGDVVVAWWAI